jgi:RND family efflux transporter MFP subunit
MRQFQRFRCDMLYQIGIGRALKCDGRCAASQRLEEAAANRLSRRLPRAIPRAALVALASLALLSACRREAEEVPEPPRPVRVTSIEMRSTGDTVTLTGSVQAETEINLSFRIDGRLIERAVNIGDAVRRGQLVARLDGQNEETSLQAALAQTNAARAQLAEARDNFGRMRDLVAENAVSRAAFEQSEVAMKTAEARVESAQAQATLAQNRLSYTRLQSDVAGVVTAQGAEVGEVVGAGRMIVQVARDGGRDAVFDVPPRIKNNAPPNAEITVGLTAEPTIRAVGRVREVSPQADPVTGTFRVRVRLTSPPAAMRLGSTVTGSMSLPAAAGIEIPASAVNRSDRQPAVWVVDPATTTVSSRSIQVQSSSDPANVVVTSGLKPGDLVVTAGAQALRPGQKVRLLENAK